MDKFKKVSFSYTPETRQGILDEKKADGHVLVMDHTNVDKSTELIFIDVKDVPAHKKQEAVKKLDRVDRYQMRILIKLIDTLVSKGVISGDDIPAGAKQKYQELKALWADAGDE